MSNTNGESSNSRGNAVGWDGSSWDETAGWISFDDAGEPAGDSHLASQQPPEYRSWWRGTPARVGAAALGITLCLGIAGIVHTTAAPERMSCSQLERRIETMNATRDEIVNTSKSWNQIQGDLEEAGHLVGVYFEKCMLNTPIDQIGDLQPR